MQAHRQTLKDYFGHILKDEGQQELASLLDVQEVRVRRQEKRMQIQAQTNQLFLPVWRKTLQDAIEESMEGQLQVELQVDYTAADKPDLREDAWHLALDAHRQSHPMLIQLLKKPEPRMADDGGIDLTMPRHQVGLLKHSGILRKLEKELQEMTGKPVRIRIEEQEIHPAVLEKQEEERQKREQMLLREVLARNSANEAASAVPAASGEDILAEPGELPWDEAADWVSLTPPAPEENEEPQIVTGDQILFGRTITGKISGLNELLDGKRTVLHGIVASKSERQVKGEKMLLQMTLTDYRQEATVKAFVPEEEYGGWSDKLKNGVTVMVKGTARQDDYLHAVTLIANHITLCEEPYPVDSDLLEAMNQMLVGTPFESVNERPLKNIEAVAGLVTVRGDVILHEANEDRSGAMGLIIDITDYTGSVPVYTRVDKERYKSIASDLKSGKVIEVLGEMQDDFKGEHKVLQAKAIRRLKTSLKPERFDDAPVKRVELHMHTKMSEMDAVTSPMELVKQAP